MKLIIAALAMAAFSPTAFANTVCLDAASDSDGDGWGWENNASCIIATVNLACIDSDGDGWGWNGTESCLIETPDEATACIDTDGDGYGWNGIDTCVVPPTSNTPTELTPEEPSVANCEDTGPQNDTWGWDGTQSCRIAPELTPQDTSAIAGLYDISDENYTAYLEFGSDGFLKTYESFIDDNCFFVFDDNNNPEEAGLQFIPLGDNLYEAFSYELFNGNLFEDREIFEMFTNNDGSLSIAFTDTAVDEFGNEVSERLIDLLPVVTDVTVAALPLCDFDL